MSMDDKEINKLVNKKIKLENGFKKYNDENGFSYQDWLNPPEGHFYMNYKKELEEIDKKLAPPLTYQH